MTRRHIIIEEVGEHDDDVVEFGAAMERAAANGETITVNVDGTDYEIDPVRVQIEELA